MLNALLVLALIGGLFPLGAELWWVFELSSHFRLQYLAIAVVAMSIALMRKRRLLAAGLVAVGIVNFWPLLPFLPTLIASPVATSVSVLNVNVNAANRNHAAILERIRQSNADFVTLIELSHELGSELPALQDLYPHRIAFPTDGNFGLALLSRYPLESQALTMLGPTRAIAARTAAAGRTFEIIAVHPLPPRSAELAATRNDQLEQLAAYIAGSGNDTIVCGDFNLSPYSPYFARFEAASGATSARRGKGLGISWPSAILPLGIPIDHCFSKGAVAAQSVQRLESVGSDHYPVVVSFGI